jgi:uncharacterized protein GlcG (DUF336 family)
MNPRYQIRPAKASRIAILLILGATLCFGAPAWSQSQRAPEVDARRCSYDPMTGRLSIGGSNFQKGATLNLASPVGLVPYSSAKVKASSKLVVSGIAPADIASGVTVKIINPNGMASPTVTLTLQASDSRFLTVGDVQTVIAQAVAQADASGLKATIAVVDQEGSLLALFEMAGAPKDTRVGTGKPQCAPSSACATEPFQCGLEGVCNIIKGGDNITLSSAAAISKAVTGAFLSSQGMAFSTRTASFIVQEHFPPGVDFQSSGPLFGVQFSQLLCSDVNRRAPLGLSADPGGVPLYKNGLRVGGIGIEGDGFYGGVLDPTAKDVPVEELVAVAATRGFEAPAEITGDKIIVNGIRFPYVNASMPPAIPTPSFGSLNGRLKPFPSLLLLSTPAAVLPAQPSLFRNTTLGGLPGRVQDAFQIKGGSLLTASEVQTVLIQAAQQAFITRAAIRQPLNSAAEVNMSVVDVDGTILGIFSTPDAPRFGFDVCVQKARTVAFFSNPLAGQILRNAGFGKYVDALAADGIKLDGSIAFSDRAIGFLARPFFPDGIDSTANGPLSVPIANFSPFNVGFQLDIIGKEYFGNLLKAAEDITAAVNATTPPCPSFPNLANGAQIFPGAVPLYKNGKLAGAVGVSGDGVDQDDIISFMGGVGFEAPMSMRSDRVFVRGVRLPYNKFPRHPDR